MWWCRIQRHCEKPECCKNSTPCSLRILLVHSTVRGTSGPPMSWERLALSSLQTLCCLSMMYRRSFLSRALQVLIFGFVLDSNLDLRRKLKRFPARSTFEFLENMQSQKVHIKASMTLTLSQMIKCLPLIPAKATLFKSSLINLGSLVPTPSFLLRLANSLVTPELLAEEGSGTTQGRCGGWWRGGGGVQWHACKRGPAQQADRASSHPEVSTARFRGRRA